MKTRIFISGMIVGSVIAALIITIALTEQFGRLSDHKEHTEINNN